jgi:hypothetical protein
MFNHRPTMLPIACLVLALAGPFTPAIAQTIQGLNNNTGIDNAARGAQPPGGGSSQFLIEPETQIKGDVIKQKTYRTDPAGQNQNWNLDIGRFQGDYTEDTDHTLKDLDNDTFSGMRLRLPFRGGMGQ